MNDTSRKSDVESSRQDQTLYLKNWKFLGEERASSLFPVKSWLIHVAVSFSGFILHLIGRETNIPESFAGFQGFTGETVKWVWDNWFSFT